MRISKKTACIVTAIAFTIFYLLYGFSHRSGQTRRQPLPTSDSEHHVNKVGCVIPYLNPFDPSASHFFKLPSNTDLSCEGPQPLVFAEGLRKLRISSDASTFQSYRAKKCYYKSVNRIDDDSFRLGESKYFGGDVNVTDEFVVVECVDKSKRVVFTDYFPFVTRKPKVEARVEKILKQKTLRKKLRVVLVGLDSMSRSQFIRHMNKTAKYIREELKFAELFAYNKVGAYTFPNILAFFTGMTEEESAMDMATTYADGLPLIWKDFSEAGYRTLYSADTPYISIFNFGRKGFKEQPTDYYWRPFGLAIEDSPLITDRHRGCYNRRPETKVILKWTEDFLDTFPDDPLFAFSYHTRLSHGNLIEPIYLDKPIQEFLQSLNSKGHFNNTVLIFFGDHGFRYGDFRTTYVGRMEDKLPFAFFILPHWFPSRYPKLYRNLQTNQHRLTTPFDIFATLRNVLDFTGKTKIPNLRERSISLLNSEVPENRTCKDASIEPQFCACVQRKRADLLDPRVALAAQNIVKTINAITAKSRKWCAELTLGTVLDASAQEVTTGDSGSGGTVSVYDFLVTLEVEPSKGMFEGTVWYTSRTNEFTVDKNIERVNLYGNQSSCINDSKQKPFCYCLVS